MPDILSQDEIDALLSALSTGEVNAEQIKGEETGRKVKPYDFRRPDKFSKEQLRTLEMIHEHLARALVTTWTSYLRVVVEMRVTSVQQLSYEEFVRSLPSTTAICTFTMTPLPGEGIFQMGNELALAIIDRLLGGHGEKISETSRELTDIEQTVLRRLLVRGLATMKDAWRNVLDVEAEFKSLESNPQFAQVAAPTQMVILVTMQTRIGQQEGLVNVCLPDSMLEPILPKLSAQYWFSGTRRGASPENVQRLRRRLEEMKVELVAVVGTAEVTLRELMALKPGDVIQLDHFVNQEVAVYVGSHHKFLGRPGLVGSRLALQVTDVVKERDDHAE
ncbi:MAG: flagellar motor switch protein FliM [Firmicutes bacterium]|nr:flagellar motor switch protein FliM [Bacillota bacterium]